jgi:hypothetical protein
LRLSRYRSLCGGYKGQYLKWKQSSFWGGFMAQWKATKGYCPRPPSLTLQQEKCVVSKYVEKDYWVSQINTHYGLSLGHISQSAKLWEMLQTVHLDHINPDTTT